MKNSAEPLTVDVTSLPVCQCLVKEDGITVLRTLGIGEFGVVQHAVWTKDTAQQVSLSACISVFTSQSPQTRFVLDRLNANYRLSTLLVFD